MKLHISYRYYIHSYEKYQLKKLKNELQFHWISYINIILAFLKFSYKDHVLTHISMGFGVFFYFKTIILSWEPWPFFWHFVYSLLKWTFRATGWVRCVLSWPMNHLKSKLFEMPFILKSNISSWTFSIKSNFSMWVWSSSFAHKKLISASRAKPRSFRRDIVTFILQKLYTSEIYK